MILSIILVTTLFDEVLTKNDYWYNKKFDADHSNSISLKFALHVAPLAYVLVIGYIYFVVL